jgi:hypothetical protein
VGISQYVHFNNNPFKSGPRKGEPRITYSLEVAPYTLNSEKGGVAWFACYGCKAASKKWNLAKTQKWMDESNGINNILQTPEEWQTAMGMNGEYGDDVLLQIASNVLHRRIEIAPLHSGLTSGHQIFSNFFLH